MTLKERFQLYKPGQGMAARYAAGGIVETMVYFGCWSLYEHPSHEGWWGTPFLSLDALNLAMNWGLTVCSLVFVAATATNWLLVVNHPKAADFLIETEAELRKVNWPARHEYLNSSFVVILSVVILSMWLVFSDMVVTFLLRRIGY